jgi:diguanylate cyclase (GGDEF)-like protein
VESEGRHLDWDRRTPEPRVSEGTTIAAPPPAAPAALGAPDSALRTSLAVTAYPEGAPCAPRLRQLARLEFSEADAQRHWHAIARHRMNLVHRVGRDVGLRVALLDYFLNIRAPMADLTIIEREALKAIERTAIVDSLTGVFNRAYFSTALIREVERCRRHRKTASVLLLDVDDLKGLNDRHGHAAGDQALRQLGELIGKHLRGVDVPCRYGGDEFVVLLPDTDRAVALTVAERIRLDVAAFFYSNSVSGMHARLTVSGGVATCVAGSPGVDALIATADRALYAAKRGGRNRMAADATPDDRGSGQGS